ncbi:hypothetical protein CcrC1_gp304 [Caulobacter phage C1]|nr:hypothetical protein CcrC1_gp304 [Caulobacter phage C1]UTU08533.1 hypothetical protein CcrC2_gp305 [Caulobacter phage C2]UTU09049.1 hypothetical protein CcrJ4_gp300 [Caulobacter phage J4]UTU09609.1 hypothetical protein CcrBL47_gp323 [Caulobacter phage BL47]UTU10166.1 hypothetical protein CcrRB23_gp304 [Caulobacter phage RB23]WGN97200.1 hypothetical protein [Bertelyvirus sp.]
MSNRRASLNGGQTKPLTPSAIAVLRSLRDFGPRPRQEINPGHNDRFEREDLTEVYRDVSPYASHKGALIPFVRIAEEGLRTLREIG